MLPIPQTNYSAVLDTLATLPSYQKGGFGSTLLKWGMQKADRHKRRIFLETMPEGMPFYLKYGWQPVEEIKVDLGQYEDEGMEVYTLMMRDPVGI